MDKKQTKVKVMIRVRPPLSDSEKTCVSVEDKIVQIFNHRNITENIHYSFSAVYDMHSTQQQIYTENVQPLLHNAVNGQNVSIFAYGPTGAGKTHTMLGTPSSPGVIPRVVNGIFNLIDDERSKHGDEWQYKVSFSFLEIYNEKVQDLLEPSGVDLPIREDKNKNILIPGLATKEIHNFDDFKNAFGPASNNRTVAATKLNNHSSRSHSIVQLMVIKSKPCRKLYGKVYLIDLAGSEDNRRTGNKGIRLKESGAINKSLFSLGEVVDAINSGLPRIPFRNSKLTRLLQDSIGGTCHSLMITNIAPEERYYYDTYCTLNFATKSKKIVNNTVVRETVGIVKPQPQVRKVHPNSHLNEEERETKRAKLDVSSDSVSSDSLPSFSPLMQRQAQLEETVERRLQELESNMLNQMKMLNSTVTTIAMPAGAETPKTKAIHEMQRQLEASNAQLKELSRKYLMGPPTSAQVASIKPSTQTVSLGKEMLQDKHIGSSPTEKNQAQQPLEVKPVNRPISGVKRKKNEEFTCSPLFACPARKFQSGFVSSACLSASNSSDVNKENRQVENTKPDVESRLVNSESQKRRNEEFLLTLNTSSIKELQSLQTVGAKRAKLIFEWRESYGDFAQAEDLMKIPGFTEKYFQKLLHSNLLTAS